MHTTAAGSIGYPSLCMCCPALSQQVSRICACRGFRAPEAVAAALAKRAYVRSTPYLVGAGLQTAAILHRQEPSSTPSHVQISHARLWLLANTLVCIFNVLTRAQMYCSGLHTGWNSACMSSHHSSMFMHAAEICISGKVQLSQDAAAHLNPCLRDMQT